MPFPPVVMNPQFHGPINANINVQPDSQRRMNDPYKIAYD